MQKRIIKECFYLSLIETLQIKVKRLNWIFFQYVSKPQIQLTVNIQTHLPGIEQDVTKASKLLSSSP